MQRRGNSVNWACGGPRVCCFAAATLVLVACGASHCIANTFRDDFEDGQVNPSLWVTHGYIGGYGGLGAGSWQWSVTEYQATDGFLEARISGPPSGLTYGAEAWVRTARNFNDGSLWTINFDWETMKAGDNGTGFAILVNDGNSTDSTAWHYWINSPAPAGSAFLWRHVVDAPGWVHDLPDIPFPKAIWSVVIDPAGSATLYQAPSAQGSAFSQVDLDASKPWYLEFVVNGGTSAGYTGCDAGFRLYDVNAVPEPASMVSVLIGLACIGGHLRRRRTRSQIPA